uniref:Uncharacterized protein n=1 Tax=Salix viminalis TaxID=40686 RepID=A0A6N2MBY5_SALVM
MAAENKPGSIPIPVGLLAKDLDKGADVIKDRDPTEFLLLKLVNPFMGPRFYEQLPWPANSSLLQRKPD